jgi:hypothetical protein
MPYDLRLGIYAMRYLSAIVPAGRRGMRCVGMWKGEGGWNFSRVKYFFVDKRYQLIP